MKRNDLSGKIKLDKTNPVPLYYQLQQEIRNLVVANEVGVGESIPTEEELQKRFGISRNTVRRAIEELIKEGILERRRSKGTVVINSGASLIEKISGRSFTERVLQDGHEPSSKLLNFEIIPAGGHVRKILNLLDDEKVVYISRLRFIDKKPTAIDNTYLPHSLVPGACSTDFGETGAEQSLFYLLENKYGFSISHWEETITAIIISGKEARLLNIPSNSPGINRVGIVYSIYAQVIAYQESLYPPNYSINYIIKRNRDGRIPGLVKN